MPLRARLELFRQRLETGAYKDAFREAPPRALLNECRLIERSQLAEPVTSGDIAAAESAREILTRKIATGEIRPGHILEDLFVETQTALAQAAAELKELPALAIVKQELSELKAAVDKAAADIPLLAGIMPNLKPWVAEVFAQLPIIDSRPGVIDKTFRETAALIRQVLALRPEDRAELDRHSERIKTLGNQALQETSDLYCTFALLPPAAQAELNKYLQILHALQPLGESWMKQSLIEYSAITRRLPYLDAQIRQAIISGIAPDTLPQTATFLGYPLEYQEESIVYLDEMRQLTKEQLLATDLRDQLRLLAAPILPAVRLAVIEEYLGRNDSGLLGARTMAKIDTLKKDPDPTVRKGANLVYGEKELRDNLVKFAECQDQAIRAGIINLYLNLKERHTGLHRIRALREHSTPSLKMGAERLYYLWVRNTVAVIAKLSGEIFQERLADLSRVPGIFKDLWAIINNDQEGSEIQADASRIKRELQAIKGEK